MNAAEVMAAIKASDKPYYAYILMKPCGAPFYVGVGRGDRLLDHVKDARLGKKLSRKLAVIRKIEASGEQLRYRLVPGFATWAEASAEECGLINMIGRADLGLGPLCNLTNGGEGAPGAVRSEFARAAVSAAQKGRSKSPAHREALRAALTGQKRDAAVGIKIAEALRGRKRPPEVIAKIRTARTYLPHTEEARAKMSAALVGKVRGPHSAETKAKISLARTGIKCSEEARANISAAQKRRFQRHRDEGGLKLPHHKGSTPEGRAKHRRPVEIAGVAYQGVDLAVATLGVGRTTIKRWIKNGTNGARRL